MSHNQSRVDKSDGQLRKSGGRSGHGRGFSGGGGGGKGGGGTGAAHPHQQLSSSSSTQQPGLSNTRSYKKSGNGQGGPPRINPATGIPQAAAGAATTRTAQNGALGQPPSQVSSTLPLPSGPKPGDVPISRTSRALPKAPSSQSAPGISDSVAPSTPAKGDGTKPFALQFGTISPGIVNGLQIPARTSSAPPNLDEQKQDQARHDSFRAVPTQPIPSGPKQQPQLARKDVVGANQPKQQPQLARKDVVGANQPTSGDSHPPVQAKWEARQQYSAAPAGPPPKSATLPIPGMSMAIPFQQPPIPMQFGGPGPQQIPMTLPIGNPSQVPQQMFVHNIQPHALQPQAMIHQGQGLGFGPQMSHQLGPQLGNLGISIAAPQFAQQQQSGKFGGSRKTTVKITHPKTHEELRLDKRMDSYTDSGSSGQRPPSNATPQSQPIASFAPSHYFPPLQPGSYNPPPIFFPTSASGPTVSQPPRFNYQVGQGGQAISFMNPSLLNTVPGSKSLSTLHGAPEPMKSESSLLHSQPGSTQGSVRPSSLPIGPKAVGASVTITVPVTKAEDPKLLKPLGDATVAHQQRDSEVSTGSASQQPDTSTQTSGITPSSASDGHPSAVTPVISTERAHPGTSLGLPIPSEDPGSDVLAADGKSKEPIKRSGSLKDHQKKPSKKDLKSSHQPQQVDVSASVTTTKLSSVNLRKDASTNDVNSRQLIGGSENIESSGTDIPTPCVDGQETRNIIQIEDIPVCVGSSRAIKEDASLSSVKDKGASMPSLSSGAEVDEDISKELTSAVSLAGNPPVEVERNRTRDDKPKHRESLISEDSVIDSSRANVHPVFTGSEFCKDTKQVLLVKQEVEGDESGVKNSEQVDHIIQDLEGPVTLMGPESKSIANDGEVPPSSEPDKAASNDQDTVSLPLNINNNHERTWSDVGLTISSVSSLESVAVEALETYDRPNGGAGVAEVLKDGQGASSIPDLKDRLVLESAKAKPAGKKKKKKDILTKADAAGTSDLYNAYKGPEEKNPLTSTSESVDSSLTVDGKNVNADKLEKDVVAVQEDGLSKTEVDDWEDAADVSTTKLGNELDDETNKHPDDTESEATGVKKYTKDFLLTFSKQCTDLPLGFEIGSDIEDALMSVSPAGSHLFDRDSHPSPGRITDRSPGASRGRGAGTLDNEKWTKTPGSVSLHNIRDIGSRAAQGVNHGVLRNPPRGQPSNQFGPIFSGHIQSMVPQGGPVRTNSDLDRWRNPNNSRGLMPPPLTPLQIMHKAEKKYEVGKVSDLEQTKQRQLKAILNKLTPQNFEKLFQQVKDVNIDNIGTLSGVISQIFDKALMEPTFCEMYANFCYHLSGDLPDFVENDDKITFKRLLLNKCQEEFERGEREQAEADRIEEEGEIKQSKEQREEKRVKARRRMLGNIRLIGELYKKKMLTERIMHECIQKLLGQYQNPPDEEDLEALCKLMSTIGDQIDHAKAKVHMDAYFDRMSELSTNQKLSSRVRFMLRDLIDLRKNRWQQRRKVEGPKKIEEVHRDAAQERQNQASRLTRGPSINPSSRRGPPVDYSPRGSVLPSPASQIGATRGYPTQARGYGVQDVRLEDRHPLENRALPLPLTQRQIDNSSIMLGPQGGLARGMSIRGQPSISSAPLAEAPMGIGDDRRMTSGPNGYNTTPDRVPYSSREDAALRYMPDRLSDVSSNPINRQERNAYAGTRESRIGDHSFDRISPTIAPSGRAQGSVGGSLSAVPDSKSLSEEVLREKSISAIREFYSAKDEKEVALCIRELNNPGFYPSMVSIWVTDSFERKDMERDLLARLLVNLCKSRDSLLSQIQLTQGFESVLSTLEDAVNDAPRAAEFLGRIFVKVVLENVVPLGDIGKLIHEGGDEPGRLLEVGLASEVLGTILENIKAEKGDSTLNEILVSSKLNVGDFRPPKPVKWKKLDPFL